MQIYPNETLNIQLLKELNKVGLMFLTIWLDSFRDSPVFLAVFTICRRRAHCRLGIWDGSFLRIFLKRKNVPVNFWGFHCWIRHALGLVIAVNSWGSPLHSAGSSRLGPSWLVSLLSSFPGIFLHRRHPLLELGTPSVDPIQCWTNPKTQFQDDWSTSEARACFALEI